MRETCFLKISPHDTLGAFSLQHDELTQHITIFDLELKDFGLFVETFQKTPQNQCVRGVNNSAFLYYY